MSLACSPSLFFMAFIAGALALGVSYYLEYAVGLKPCGLCLMQRGSLALLTSICLLAAVQGPGRLGTFLYWLLVSICSLGGMVTAWRQVVLQSDPLRYLSDCSSGLSEVFKDAPWLSRVEQLFSGTAECAQMSWTLFDLSIPEWSLLFFVAVMVLAGAQMQRLLWIAFRRPLSGESSHRALAGD